MAKPKATRKTIHKTKKTNTVHPHIECIQAEITALEEKLNTLEELEKSRELTSEEQVDREVTERNLVQTQSILTKLTEPSMLNKLRSHQDITARDTREKDELLILSLLQLFYMMRLGQLGLFDYIQPPAAISKNISKAINEICDQMVGASVYYATNKSPRARSENKTRALQLLRQFDRGAEDLITEEASFKDVKQFIQHIWEHTVEESQLANEGGNAASSAWAVLQFNNMMDPVQPVPSQAVAVGLPTEETVVVEQPTPPEEIPSQSKETVVEQSSQPEDAAVVVDDLTKDEPTTKDNENDNEVTVSESSQGWGAAPDKNQQMDSWKKDASWDSRAAPWGGNGSNLGNEKPNSSNLGKRNKRWPNKGHTPTNDRNTTTPSWDTPLSAEEHGWDTIDNTIKGDGWENIASITDNDHNWAIEPVVEEQIIVVDSVQVTTPPASPKQQEPNESTEESRPRADFDSNDDWRRSRSGRGVGRSSGSRGGKFRGRGRGRGSGLPGRGRGKGRGRDYESQQLQPQQD